MAPAKKPAEPKAPAAAPAAAPTPAASSPAPSGQKTNALAVVALVLAILSIFISWTFLFAIIGLILGIVAKGQIKKNNESGKGAATAAVVISSISIVFGIIIIVAFVALGFYAKDQAKKQGVDINNGSINVQGKDGSSVSIGNAKLPDGFPSDVPVYSPSKITGSSKYNGNKYTVVLTTADSASKVQDYYKTQLEAQGWSSGEGTGSINFESGTVATFTKGNQTLFVTITSQNKGGDNNTLISLTVGPKDTTE